MPDGHEDPDEVLAEIEADLGRLVQRLRSLSPTAWRSRREVVTHLLTGLEQITAELEGRPPRPIPALPDHARADAVAVLAGDVVTEIDQLRTPARLSEVGRLIRYALDATR